MSEAFWWYVLAGFLLGFSVSTLWEWIYFRRRRMNIRDRRIAELEATVRAYTAAANIPNPGAATDDWAEPTFQSPGIYLETEEAPAAAPAPGINSTVQQTISPFVVATAATLNSAPSPAVQATGDASAAPTVTATTPVVAFQSLAVQQPPPLVRASERAGEGVAIDDLRPSAAPAASGAATALPREAIAATIAETPATTSAPDAHAAAHASVYVNGVAAPTTQAGSDRRASGLEQRTMTHAEIGALVSSINELIDTVSQEQKATAAASLAPETPTLAASDGPYVTHISGRAEYVLVRIVQSFVQFIRQLRQIVTGAEASRPEVRPPTPDPREDDLTQIAGLGTEHAARLRAAGVTTYSHLAALSPEELRTLALTPGEGASDPAQWLAQAQQLATTQQAGRRDAR